MKSGGEILAGIPVDMGGIGNRNLVMSFRSQGKICRIGKDLASARSDIKIGLVYESELMKSNKQFGSPFGLDFLQVFPIGPLGRFG
ncbi:hypothetical protein R1flu_017655 [Riccia fluitans]|uniref:Uncharacterized protein n=1 Tax=Riccia fluitans TaxID=41844 RepID=A0ABD1ZDS8_9MARC